MHRTTLTLAALFYPAQVVTQLAWVATGLWNKAVWGVRILEWYIGVWGFALQTEEIPDTADHLAHVAICLLLAWICRKGSPLFGALVAAVAGLASSSSALFMLVVGRTDGGGRLIPAMVLLAIGVRWICGSLQYPNRWRAATSLALGIGLTSVLLPGVLFGRMPFSGGSRAAIGYLAYSGLSVLLVFLIAAATYRHVKEDTRRRTRWRTGSGLAPAPTSMSTIARVTVQVGVHQNGLILIVLATHVGAVFDKKPGNVLVTLRSGQHEPGASVGGAGVDFGTMLQKRFRKRQVAAAGGKHQGSDSPARNRRAASGNRGAVVHFRVDVGLRFEHGLNQPVGALQDRPHERRSALIVSGVDFGPVGKQQATERLLSAVRSLKQGGDSLVIRDVQIGPLAEQALGGRYLAIGYGDQQRRIPFVVFAVDSVRHSPAIQR